ncbi:ribonuclease H-like domain-containing protein [Tanacetum coccineum]
MSEAEPIPPTSSVTALRIPMIKKDQATTDPASSSAPKTSLAANARRNNEKALNILLSAIPDRHLLIATMIRGQPGLDELEFDDLYNNLKVYEHELKGVSNSSSQNIAFLSTEVKGSTLKQNEIICSFFAQQASMPTTHDDEDLLQIDEDAMEEIDIRWQVAMITARIRKFMRKTGRPIDLKPKNGITFDKSKIECFNCQKLGHFARECRFAKYQENRANGRNEKRIVAIEDSNSKALVATDNNEDIDWTKNFDAVQWTLVIFDWSNKADDTPSVLALMVTYSEGYLKLEENKRKLDQALKERDDFKVKLEKWTNASVLQNEVLNKQRYLSDKSCIGFGVESSNGMESENSSGNTNSTESLYPNFQKTKGFHSVPPPTGTLTKGGLLSHQQYLQGKVKSTLPDQIMTRTVPSRSTANVFYLDTARPRVPHAVLSQSTGRPYYPMMDNIRPRYFTFQDSFKLDHSMFGMVERVNRTGLLARRLKKNSPENPIIELLHMDLFGPVLVDECK